MATGNHTTVNIVGAGLAGLSAAIHLAMEGIPTRLISTQPSERAQSVLAEGGINGALNTMGEDDCTKNHYNDTMKAGCEIGDPEAVEDLTTHAPEVIRWLDDLGVPFQRKGDVILQRNFGGQKKKRTAFAHSSIGKVLMTALIDEARKYEVSGLITRYPHHDFVKLILARRSNVDSKIEISNVSRLDEVEVYRSDIDKVSNTGIIEKDNEWQVDIKSKVCLGVIIRDHITGEIQPFSGPVLMACGGLNGLFPGRTTGTTANTGDAAAVLFTQGVTFSNLEMIQYHPTTLSIPDKRLLVSEAARGEGGRLFVERGGSRWYFMEEKYPELGNLMPRDVVSREEYFVMHDPACGDQVFLDCTGLSAEIWKTKLPDLREEVIYYTGLDPAKKPIPVEPGIHYFMGGIDTDAAHRTNVQGLYAAGECCSLYHGANRLGGNSTLGATYGGQRAAQTITQELDSYEKNISDPSMAASDKAASNNRTSKQTEELPAGQQAEDLRSSTRHLLAGSKEEFAGSQEDRDAQLGQILYDSLGVVRDQETITKGMEKVKAMLSHGRSPREQARCILGLAILESAMFRKESRGAQYRSDYPERNNDYRGTVVAAYAIPVNAAADDGDKERAIHIWLRKVKDIGTVNR